ncbi:odorant receptor 94a-like [Glossina fuscipes fuscipes]
MQFSTTENSRLIIYILSKCGVLRDPAKILPLNIMLHVPITFTLTTLMWLKVIFSSNFNDATDVIYIAFTETTFVIKVLSAWRFARLLQFIFLEWQTNNLFSLKSANEHLIWNGQFKTFKIIAFVYISCSLSVLILSFVSVPYMETYRLPFAYWTPAGWEQSSYFWYICFYDFIGMAFTCISNCTVDMYFCYLLKHIAVCFRMISMRLVKLGYTSEDVTKNLKEIITFHSKLKSMSRHCEKIISYPILGQILFSSVVLCFSIYRLQAISFIETPLDFLSVFQYMWVMAAQIYLPCHYCNELTLQSAALHTAVYNCNWIDMTAAERKNILLFMLYVKRPIILRAGHFFEIGLPIFTKTMNNAYSLLALVLNISDS